jgi:hypothetical protein
MKKEIPILFSTPMVQAILAGRKTQTRRIVKFPKDYDGKNVYQNGEFGLKYSCSEFEGYCLHRLFPKWVKEDLLWVRETYTIFEPEHCEGMKDRFCYKASFHESNDDWRKECIADGYSYKWKPSIFMPKVAARIWLEVTNVRAERLHDISNEDVVAEGVDWKDYSFQRTICREWGIENTSSYSAAFFMLWQQINGLESLEANPWVWVVSFKVLSTTGKP